MRRRGSAVFAALALALGPGLAGCGVYAPPVRPPVRNTASPPHPAAGPETAPEAVSPAKARKDDADGE